MFKLQVRVLTLPELWTQRRSSMMMPKLRLMSLVLSIGSLGVVWAVIRHVHRSWISSCANQHSVNPDFMRLKA
jgi:hypothetical protein